MALDVWPRVNSNPEVAMVDMKSALGYLLGIAGAEVMLNFRGSPLEVIGAISICIVLVAIVVHIQRTADRYSRVFFMSLAVVPLYRLMSAVPSAASYVFDIDGNLFFYSILNPMLLVTALVLLRITKIPVGEIGLNLKRLPSQMLIGLTGIIFGPVLFYLVRPEPLSSELDSVKLILPIFVILLGAAAEEIVFRGALQRASIQVFRGRGLLYASLVFTVIHIGHVSGMNLSIASIPFIFFAATFYGLVVKRTGSLLGVTVSHFVTNIFFFLVAPLAFQS